MSAHNNLGMSQAIAHNNLNHVASHHAHNNITHVASMAPWCEV
jgi:hypothetical protein